MPSATPLFTTHAYKAEGSYGVIPAAGGAQVLRRVTASLDLGKDTYESQEQRPDMQRADMRHGVRRVTGKLSGELSCGSFADWLAACVKRAWSGIANITGLTLTIATSASNYAITRSAGDWLAGGIKVGTIGFLTGGTAGNINKRFVVLNVTATVLTVNMLNGATLTTETAVAGYSLSTPGKINYLPLTGHLSTSFALEKWFADLVQSEVYSGIRPTKCTIKLPPSGLATIEFELMGQDVTTGAAQYFTSPTVALTTGLIASVNGAARVAGSVQAQVTGLEITITCPWAADPVVGSNVLPETVPDTVTVSGNMTCNFTDVTLRDAFRQETEVELVVAVTTDSTATTSALSLCLSRVKLTGAAKSDEGGKYVVQTIPFEALLNGSGGTGTKYEATTIWMQDTTL